jgi:hypothetical protein
VTEPISNGHENILSPRRLLEHLHATLQLDDVVLDGYVLADCFRLDAGEPLRVELRRDRDRFELQVEPAVELEERRPLARVAGLDVSYRNGAPSDLAAAACRRFAEHLQLALGDAPRRWTFAPPSLRELPARVAAELRFEPATLDRDPDRELLRRDFANYERLYGVRPEVVAVHVEGTPAPGVSIHYPAAHDGRVPNSGTVYPLAPRIAHRRRMRRYFAGLGCLADDDGFPRTVPTPTTFTRALDRVSSNARMRPRMIAGVSASLRPIHWGVLVRRNLLPVTVAPRWSVEVHRRIRDIGPLQNIPCDVGMLPHDMSVHALALHAVPGDAWDELLAEGQQRVRARPWSVLAGPWGVLARLASFFEGAITTRCWAAWQEAEEPDEFADRFAPHFDALVHELRSL